MLRLILRLIGDQTAYVDVFGVAQMERADRLFEDAPLEPEYLVKGREQAIKFLGPRRLTYPNCAVLWQRGPFVLHKWREKRERAAKRAASGLRIAS